ncbi:MAG: PaREP1 family protein [Ignisphaera sp.]
MEGFLDYKKNPREYVYAKVYESLIEGRLALEMLKRGLLQNASSKAFMSVKSAISAIVVENFDKILEGKNEKERFWYENVGYSAPTTGLIGISRDLKKLNIDVEFVVRIALSLHRFSYNGFDPNFVDYRESKEVEEDIKEAIKWLLSMDLYIKFDEKLEKEKEEIRKLLLELEGDREGTK